METRMIPKLDKKQLKEKALQAGKLGAGFAFKAAVVYIITMLLCFIGGGVGGYYGADYFAWAGWKVWVCTITGLIAGIVGGFYAGQMIVYGMVQDLMLDAGIEAGKAGYKAAKQKLAEKEAKDEAEKAALPKPPPEHADFS
jgi:hypothetical protein